ncbi:MAG: DNA repair protein RecN [Bacteroidetes bacterium ADurb.Bin408]|nr:MAG: DNA repair protein RecN [Bacteroidetes bacterium ADurb.Bin408]
MIKHLSVSNYALIEKLELDFDKGITVITGETGAGKSILLGALSLVLGQRADTSVLYDNTIKCIVEGHFDISKYNLEDFFAANELDYENICIVRREILPNNRSRAFINDTPVNANLLRDFADTLIDIHSQHDTLSLLKPDYQLAILDDFSGNITLLDKYKTHFNHYIKLKNQLEEMLAAEEKSKADEDYLSFLLNELLSAQLKEEEQSEAEKELELLNNAGDIKKNLSKASYLLNQGEYNVLSMLKEVADILKDLSSYLPALEELKQRTEATYIELKDIESEIEKNERGIVFSPEQIESLNERLNLIYNLQKKHRVNTVAELLSLAEAMKQKLHLIDNLDEEIKLMKKNIQQEETVLKTLADELFEKRKKNIPVLIREILALLKELAMPSAQIEIPVNKTPGFRNNGTEDISFLFSANKGTPPARIADVASGGELSRLMLAFKSVISTKKLLPTLIFDEIDTGISGETAVKTASILNKMGKNMQIIVITHLPQIASIGNQHLVVNKTIVKSKAVTTIQRVTGEERIGTVAGMISGRQLTEASLSTARELIEKFSEN